jgi:pilus assembly protein CpaB
MRPKSILLLALALGCGLIASWGISDVMERNAKRDNTPVVETEKIYVALKDINVNEALTPELVVQEDWPKDKVPHDALRILDEMVGRRAGDKLYEGEPIRNSRLVGANQSAAAQLPKGYRPYPVRVSAESSAAGLIKPGDHVDVQLFVKRNPPLGIEETRTQTIMSNLRVFAVDQVYNRAAEDQEAQVVASTISLVVTTEQANKLSLASRLGEMNLMLRHPDDEELANDSTSVDELFGLEEGDREAERESASIDPNSILQKLKGMKDGAAGTVGPEQAIAVEPVVDTAPPHQMMVLRGNEIEVIEFPNDGRLPSNMPAAKPPAHQSGQSGLNLPDQTSSDAPAATPADKAAAPIEETSQPKLQETDGDSTPPSELDELSNLKLNDE